MLRAVLEKVQALLETRSQETGVGVVVALLSFPANPDLLSTILSVLVNIVPLCDQHYRKQIAVQLRYKPGYIMLMIIKRWT